MAQRNNLFSGEKVISGKSLAKSSGNGTHRLLEAQIPVTLGVSACGRLQELLKKWAAIKFTSDAMLLISNLCCQSTMTAATNLNMLMNASKRPA